MHENYETECESPAEWKETFGTGSKMEINKNAIK
jgi:hypothetical protein